MESKNPLSISMISMDSWIPYEHDDQSLGD